MNDPLSPFLQDVFSRPPTDVAPGVRLEADASPYLGELEIGESRSGAERSRRVRRVESTSAKLEWMNVTFAKGSDGQQHAYLVLPEKGGGTFPFQLKITNTNAVYNLRKPRLLYWLFKTDLRKETLIGKGSRWLKGEIEDGQPVTEEVPIKIETMDEAYRDPMTWTRLDVELNWGHVLSSSEYYYARRALRFFLVRPIEVLLKPTPMKREVSTATKRQFWMRVWEKTFDHLDRSPTTVTGTVSYSVTHSDSAGIEFAQKNATTDGTTNGISTSLTIGEKDVLAATVGAEATKSSSATKEHSAALQKTVSRSVNRTQSLQVTTTIADPGPNKTRTLYHYPIFGIHDVTVVRFAAPLAGGWATGRTEAKIEVPILKGWGERQHTAPAGKKEI